MHLLILSLFASLSQAHDVPGEEHGPPNSHAHTQKIFVLGNEHSSSILDLIPTVSTLEGDNLVKRRSTSLGETLKNEVGVTATGYGPTASRPVIRGLEGDRIRILQNGIGVLDASGASQDHAVPLDPISAESIEIVRGPINLLYGSSAVGGVVNVTNMRIHEEYNEGFTGIADLQGSTVNLVKSVAAKVDYGVGEHWMFHVDGSFNKTENLKVPGYVHSRALRISTPQTPEPWNKVPNSASEINSTAVGATYVLPKGHLGISASTFNNHYGVVAEESVKVEMEQQRFDIAGEWRDFTFLKAMRLKTALSIYKHQEIEDGAPGTTFKNNGNETRLEFVQKDWENLKGLVGLQFNTFKFSALGDEAFLPKTDNLSSAIFAFEELDFSPLKWNFGARAELSQVKPEADSKFTLTKEESFNTGSVSTGWLYNFTQKFSSTLNLSYNERAPNYQELFSGGAHVATFTFQQGDPNLQKEKSIAAEVSLRHQSDFFTGSVNVFGQRYHDFIALSPTGTIDDTDGSGTAGDSVEDLPIYNYLAQAAMIYGAEMDLHFSLTQETLPGKFSLQVKGDYLRGKNPDTGFNLPRMSPPRASVGLIHKWEKLTSDVEVQQIFQQTKVAINESTTDGYVQTNLGANYKFLEGKQQWAIFARVNNAFNVNGRNHVSFLKDYTQVGGRNFTLGVRAYF